MAIKDGEFLWKEYCSDTSQVWEGRNIKSISRSAYFMQKKKEELDAQLLLVGNEDCSDLLRVIKYCSKHKDLQKGRDIHAAAHQRGLLKQNVYVGTALISMYASCGALSNAQGVFDELPAHDVISWNSLIAGFAQHELADETLKCFQQMQDESVSPNPVTYVWVLKVCSTGRIKIAYDIHAAIHKLGLLWKDVVLGTSLIDVYAKCGYLEKARVVFSELPMRDVVSWSALIAGFVEYGHNSEALEYFAKMQGEGVSANSVTYTCILKACGSMLAMEVGKDVHAEISKQGLFDKDMALGNALVDMYARCGLLPEAEEVFGELRVRDIVSWSALIAGYVRCRLDDEALKCFECMQNEGVCPDAVIFACILKACGSIAAPERGERIHVEISKQGLLVKHIMLGNALVDMYGKCGWLAKAQKVFDELPLRNVISWTALIAGYVQHGLDDEALKCYERMQDEHVSPNAVTFACLLKACGNLGVIERGEEIHAAVSKQGFLGEDAVLGNALVHMYGKCGSLAKAQDVFDHLAARDVVSWTALICGYAEHGLGDEALKWFQQMCNDDVSPDTIMFASILKACVSIGAFEVGREIHSEVVKEGLLGKSIVIGNALLDMYAKCGSLTIAQQVFEKLLVRDVVSWSSLISGFANHGHSDEAFKCFKRMQGEGVTPNEVTFTILLTACCQGGLLEEGRMHYNNMKAVHGITPTLRHCACMVDLFSDAGHFDEAISILKMVSPSERLELWMTVLGACRKWVYVQLGKVAFEHVVKLDEKYAASYFCMSNLYVDAGMQEEAERIEALRIKNKAWKIPGHCWWIDSSRNVHLFAVGDQSHPESKLIYAKLEDIQTKLMWKRLIEVEDQL